MIVEFIGASGAGKSTLARALAGRPAPGVDVTMAWDLVLDRPGLRWIIHPTARNLVAEVATLPALLRGWPGNRDFVNFAREILRDHARSTFEQLNYQRSILRKVGLHELARRRGTGAVVLADEGTVLTAYYLFVYVRSRFRTQDVDRFAALVPLPDRIVYVKAPMESLIERAMFRSDRRRELASMDRTEVAHWIGRAVEVFDYLATTFPIHDRILTVDNIDGSTADREHLVDRIGEFAMSGAVDAQHPPRRTTSVGVLGRARMLTTVRDLLEHLNGAEIRYCHWKSNWALDRTLKGETDLDLLIERSGARAFRALLVGRGFEPSIETGVHPLPSTEHYHALDGETGVIVHVHVYYRVITGESIAKNYRLPIEEMLLHNPQREGLINVPVRGAELIVFVLRMLIKHTTPVELAFLLRDWGAVRHEAEWLVTEAAVKEAEELLERWLPRFDGELFQKCVEALRQPDPLLKRIVLGYRVRAVLRGFNRKSAAHALFSELWRFSGLVTDRLMGSTCKLTPAGGGAVIAFVGSEATGKSTMLTETQRWLGEHYTVTRIHAGKPPATALTFIPHSLLPVLRRLLPEQRSTRVEAGYFQGSVPSSRTFPLMFGIRSLMLAHERKVLLTRAFARSSNGTIVLCDRYPSSRSGAPDSPQLGHLPLPAEPAEGHQAPRQLSVSLRRWLAALEAKIYRDIPRPDLVIYLTAPLDVTLARNAARAKTEEEAFVRTRHSQTSALEFDGAPVNRIDTDQPLEATLREVRRVIWDAL